MKTYISILRGINVSGKNILKMKELQEMYHRFGFTNIKTYIQSGNVVFRYKEIIPEELERLISAEILKQFNLDVPVLVRGLEELGISLSQNPFLDKDGVDVNGLYITYLSRIPEPNLIQNLEAGNYLPDEFVILGRTIYLNCRGGYGKTKLSNNFFERKLIVKATTRNLRTLEELVKMGKQLEIITE